MEEDLQQLLDELDRKGPELGLGADRLLRLRHEVEQVDFLRELEEQVEVRSEALLRINETLEAEIAQRRQAEDAVLRERQRLTDVLEMLPVFVTLITQDHRILVANRMFRERVGDPQGARCFEHLYGSAKPCERCVAFEALETGAPQRREVTATDGRDYDILAFRFTDADGSAMVLKVGLDITERNRATSDLRQANATLELRVNERTARLETSNARLQSEVAERLRAEAALQQAKEAAEAANVAKSQFLANMSHELRTPMNAIIGMTELVLEEDLSPTARDCLETARESAGSLLELVNEILDLSRIEAGRVRMEPEVFRLRQLIERTLKSLAYRASQQGLELVHDVSDDVPDLLVGDPLLLRQVLVNLVGNAIKFTDSGAVLVSASVVMRAAPAIVVAFAVADTGIGISAADQERIFEPFTQVDGSTTRQRGGTGLGLTIVQRLVTLMDGAIRVESRPGEGSTFTFTARFGEPAAERDEPAADPSTAAAPGAAPARSLQVLVVEDTPASQKLATLLLQRRGHRVEVVGNGREALERLRSRSTPPDVVLMDVQMPVMDGLQATAAIRRSEDPAVARLPIIAMTAHALKGDRERCLGAGMDAYVSKPLNGHEMVRLVERLGTSIRTARSSGERIP